jgi:hypothetical protein
LSVGICSAISLVIVVGLFRLVQPISVLVKVVQSRLSRDGRRAIAPISAAPP